MKSRKEYHKSRKYAYDKYEAMDNDLKYNIIKQNIARRVRLNKIDVDNVIDNIFDIIGVVA